MVNEPMGCFTSAADTSVGDMIVTQFTYIEITLMRFCCYSYKTACNPIPDGPVGLCLWHHRQEDHRL